MFFQAKKDKKEAAENAKPRKDRRCGPKYKGATCDPEGKSPSLLSAEQNRKVRDRRIPTDSGSLFAVW